MERYNYKIQGKNGLLCGVPFYAFLALTGAQGVKMLSVCECVCPGYYAQEHSH